MKVIFDLSIEKVEFHYMRMRMSVGKLLRSKHTVVLLICNVYTYIHKL